MQIPTVLYKLTPYSANLLFSSDNSHQPARQTFHESQSTQAWTGPTLNTSLGIHAQLQMQAYIDKADLMQSGTSPAAYRFSCVLF